MHLSVLIKVFTLGFKMLVRYKNAQVFWLILYIEHVNNNRCV